MKEDDDDSLDFDTFEEIDINTLPISRPVFVRCTKKQRELIERRSKMSYAKLIQFCNHILKKKKEDMIRDIGQLSVIEADEVIKALEK